MASEEEKTATLVWCADVACLNSCPPAVIPVGGKESKDSGTSESKDSWNVLQQDVSGSNHANAPLGDVLKDGPLIVLSPALTSCGERLAREAGAKQVDLLGGSEVRCNQVAVVGDIRVVGGEDLRACRVDLAGPYQFRPGVVGHDSVVEAPVAGAQASYSESTALHACFSRVVWSCSTFPQAQTRDVTVG